MPTSENEQLAVNTIRTLSIDMVQKANSGHPGLPLGMAPVAYTLFADVLKHNPADPHWPDRDRFVLSAGHGSALLYSVLHLSGYDLPLEQLEQFRQWGSLTPGHPERDLVHVTPGVEVTTGPLGQGFANGVGMAMAEEFLREHFGTEVQDHYTYAIVSDGDLMEGIASEAASLAGHLGLGRLIYIYDDNDVSLDGPTDLSYSSSEVTPRFEGYGWHVIGVDDANDVEALKLAIEEGKRETDKPTLIRVRSIIGYGSPKAGTSAVHGSALGEDNVRATKEALGWDPDAHFLVPDGVYEQFKPEAGAEQQAAWQQRLDAWKASDPERAKAWDLAWAGKPLPGLEAALPDFADVDSIATRAAGGKTMAAFEPFTPTMIGGAADLSGSTSTKFPESGRYVKDKSDRNVYWGVREHGMGGAVNGLAAHGGIVRPYGSTFMQFSDYMRGAIRLSALSALDVVWVYTHDSVALGEDGPTHQPVEHMAALRAIPELTTFRPADATETAEAWRVILEELSGPAVLVLSRQGLPVLHRGGDSGYAPVAGVGKGAYVLRDAADPEVVLVGTGSEVSTALAAADLLAKDGIPARVVSFPSWELFEAQDEEYQESVLPIGIPSVSVEAGISMGWAKWVDASVSIDRFGASAPGEIVLEQLGITAENVADTARELIS
jgi:transketolase